MDDSPKPHLLVAKFLTASTPLEKHLQQGGPLTELESQSVAITISNLQLFFDIWKKKRGKN